MLGWSRRQGVERRKQGEFRRIKIRTIGMEISVEGQLATSCTLVIIPNLTRGARPYGLIENVVTHAEYRQRGIGTRLLRHALQIAWEQNCYKVMLLTGRQDEATLRFYEKAGFQRGLKTGVIAKPD